MAERHSYEAGTPNWVDIGSHDLAATKSFYCELFDWTAVLAGPEDVSGGYGMFQRNGLDVAGFGPAQASGQWWSVYISVDDVTAACSRVTEAGGSTLVEPMRIDEAGHMAVCADPTGAAFSLWQAERHVGARLVNEPNTFAWAELLSRDLESAIGFYGSVFGWTAKTTDGVDYTEWHLNSQPIGGAMTMPDMVDKDVPSNWGPYFAVADLNEAIETTLHLGGAQHMGPMSAGDIGDFAILGGPGGEVFNVIEYTEPAP